MYMIRESDAKQAPPFHSFLQIFYKNFKVSVLSFSLSHFAPVFKKTDEKPVQILGVFCFYVIRSYTRISRQLW